MTSSFSTQGIQDLLAFPFRDSDSRKKLLIAALLNLANFIIPIVPGLFLVGYGGLIMRRIIKEKGEAYMPAWQDWSGMLSLGFKMSAAMFLYMLPIGLIFILSYVGMLIPMFTDILSNRYGTEDIGRTLSLQFGGMFIWLCGFGVAMLLIAALWLLLPAALGHLVARDSFAAAFEVGEWWRIWRANWGGFIVAMVLIGGVYMATLMVAQVLYMTLILCLLLPVVFSVIGAYIWLIASVVFADAYQEATARLESQPPAPAAAPTTA